MIVNAALNTLDTAQLQAAFNQLHPALFEALALSVRDTTHLINTTFIDRLDYLRRTSCCNPCACQSVGLWSAGVADFVRQDRTEELRRFSATNQGLAFGFDNRICDSVLAGVGAGYTHTNLHWEILQAMLILMAIIWELMPQNSLTGFISTVRS